MPKIPINDTSRIFNHYQKEIENILLKTAQSGFWLLGERTKVFSKSFSDYCGAEHCLPLANGTDALELALRVLVASEEVQDRGEIITVANAGGYTSTACRLVGLTPVYADVDEQTQLIDLDSLVNCLNTKVKAVVLTHLYGNAINVVEVRKILDAKGYSNVKIIEDCAQAHGASFAGKKVGSFGDIATFSFYPTKNLGAFGDAGTLLTSDKELYLKAKELSQYGWSSRYHIQRAYGRNSRIDELQAAILSVLLPYLDEHNQQRKEIYRRYQTASKKLQPLKSHCSESFVAHLAVFRTDKRKEFIDFMSDKFIQVGIHYPVLDTEQEAWKHMPFRIDSKKGLPSSKKSTSEIVTLPCFPYMSDEEVLYVCNVLKEWDEL